MSTCILLEKSDLFLTDWTQNVSADCTYHCCYGLGYTITAVRCSYYIMDAKHGRSIVAGNIDIYDGRIYHQDPTGRLNAKWVLEPITGDLEPTFYLIRDTKHNKYIVAGDRYDGNVYHQTPNNRSNAKWQLVPFTDDRGSKTFNLIDKKHNRALVAGDVADNRMYHQYPNRRPNANGL